ncbi:ABC transporter substrate-binding protein [Lysinibacillus sp. SGAir0095]|uniref:ABC transporter substrate-binding protein n=1 Tax=Lysinibacillus sp. SGAir0095 TaxID=2070463 RepID=UPI0010CD1363|nr:ABC transporter substrate-binding protein [Lysinibacillus sp. SGAir0095]QCR33382.1 ABC transporter substrate-binding protein [Lysinibacillus sp. SGAir0095]
MEKNTKRALFILVSMLIGGLLVGCSSKAGGASAQKGEDKVLQYQGTPSTVSYPELAADLGYLGDLTLEDIGTGSGGPESIQLTGTGEIDFGSAFNGAIVKAVSKGAKLKSVVGSYGSDEYTYMGVYVLEDSGIQSAKDLIGKKIGVNTLGAHAEFVIKDFLRQNNLTEEEIAEVQLVTIPSSNAEQSLRNNQLDAVQLSGIGRDLALERGEITELFRDIDVFGGEFTAGDYFFTVKYIKENPTTVKTFTEGVAKAIDWAQMKPAKDVIARFEKIISKREGNQTTDYMRFWKSSGIAEKGGLIKESEYSIWIDWLIKNGELEAGKISAKDLYTNEFNPYAK